MRLADARFESGGVSPYVRNRQAREDCLTERDISRGDFCRARSPRIGWVCTRPLGHVGDHVAHISREIIAARWAKAEEG